MTMLTIKIFHGFGLSLLGLYAGLTVYNEPRVAPPYIAFGLVYLLLFLGLLQGQKWCLRFSIIPPIIVVLTTLPFVLYNLWAFVSGDPRYLDSPATIIVVGIFACFTTLPSLIVLYAYWAARKVLLGQEID